MPTRFANSICVRLSNSRTSFTRSPLIMRLIGPSRPPVGQANAVLQVVVILGRGPRVREHLGRMGDVDVPMELRGLPVGPGPVRQGDGELLKPVLAIRMPQDDQIP